MPGVKSYDPKNIAVIFGGVTLSGFTDGTFVNIERNSDMWSLKVGVDGHGTRAKTNDHSAKCTITLQQSSESNDYLSAQANADNVTPGGTGGLPLLIRDNSGTTICTSLTAWVKKMATMEDGKDVANRVWVIETDNMQMIVGGN